MTTASDWVTQSAIPAPPGVVVAIRDGDGNRCVHSGAALLVQSRLGADTRVMVGILNNRGYVVPADELGTVVFAAPATKHSSIELFT